MKETCQTSVTKHHLSKVGKAGSCSISQVIIVHPQHPGLPPALSRHQAGVASERGCSHPAQGCHNWSYPNGIFTQQLQAAFLRCTVLDHYPRPNWGQSHLLRPHNHGVGTRSPPATTTDSPLPPSSTSPPRCLPGPQTVPQGLQAALPAVLRQLLFGQQALPSEHSKHRLALAPAAPPQRSRLAVPRRRGAPAAAPAEPWRGERRHLSAPLPNAAGWACPALAPTVLHRPDVCGVAGVAPTCRSGGFKQFGHAFFMKMWEYVRNKEATSSGPASHTTNKKGATCSSEGSTFVVWCSLPVGWIVKLQSPHMLG